MSLGAATREINVYGRRHKRVVSRSGRIEDEKESTEGRESERNTSTPNTSGRLGGLSGLGGLTGLFAGLSIGGPNRRSGDDVSETVATSEPDEESRNEVLQADELTQAPFSNQSALDAALETTNQPWPVDFGSHISHLCKCRKLSKLGEASYSEVFLLDGEPRTVVKVIPLYTSAPVQAQSAVTDVHREMSIMKTLAHLDGFVKLQGMHIVRGEYPTELLDAWDAFREAYPKRNENSRPAYNVDQLYALLLMDDGGEELEQANLSWVEAAGVFWQVAGALAAAEDLGFEVRLS